MRRWPVTSSGSDEYSQLAAGFRSALRSRLGPRPGMAFPSRFKHNTLYLPVGGQSVRHTDPADPAPTTINHDLVSIVNRRSAISGPDARRLTIPTIHSEAATGGRERSRLIVRI